MAPAQLICYRLHARQRILVKTLLGDKLPHCLEDLPRRAYISLSTRQGGERAQGTCREARGRLPAALHCNTAATARVRRSRYKAGQAMRVKREATLWVRHRLAQEPKRATHTSTRARHLHHVRPCLDLRRGVLDHCLGQNVEQHLRPTALIRFGHSWGRMGCGVYGVVRKARRVFFPRALCSARADIGGAPAGLPLLAPLGCVPAVAHHHATPYAAMLFLPLSSGVLSLRSACSACINSPIVSSDIERKLPWTPPGAR